MHPINAGPVTQNETFSPSTQPTPPGTCQSSGRADASAVLFVGGTKAWFVEVEHALLELRPGWSAHHAIDRCSADKMLAGVPYEAVVIDDAFSGAADFLAGIRRAHPSVWACSLSEALNPGKAEPVDGWGNAPASPAHPGEIAPVLVRAIAVHQWSSRPSVKALLAQIKKLPTVPEIHLQVTRELQSPNGSLEVASQLVRRDPVMSAKFLQVINSPLFGMAYAVSDPGEAVMFLGAVRTRALIFMAGIFSQFEETPGEFSVDQIWQHSLQVASLSQGITLMQTEDPKLADAAFTAGLLHDIGKLVLAGNVPQMYATAFRLQQHKRIQQAEAELAILNTSHAELGACLLGTWRLSLPIVEAVAWHHKPSQAYDTGFSLLTAVHAGNVLAHEMVGGNTGVALPPRFDVFYLAKLGLAGQRNVWREGCGLPRREEVDTFEDTIRRRLEAKRN